MFREAIGLGFHYRVIDAHAWGTSIQVLDWIIMGFNETDVHGECDNVLMVF